MTQSDALLTPHRVIAQRVKELRTGRGWSAQRLGEEMTQAGVRWDRSIVANFEHGRRAYVTVEELLTLAYVLDVAPVHLLVPPGNEQAADQYSVTPQGFSVEPWEARAWIRGQRPIGLVSPRRYFSEVPDVEWVPPDPQQVRPAGPQDRPPTLEEIPVLRAWVDQQVGRLGPDEDAARDRYREYHRAIDDAAANLQRESHDGR